MAPLIDGQLVFLVDVAVLVVLDVLCHVIRLVEGEVALLCVLVRPTFLIVDE